MHLDKLIIKGFKSFADEVELVFEPGITAIVGPNGCGKSNVSDAIRWVLGEQSSRSLRCRKMEDVIFNGGVELKPKNLSAVTLRLDNEDSILPLETPAVEIMRQLHRSGESGYFINQSQCLLRDISELFMDTGVGMTAYSLMEQSNIDVLLNTQPQERRFLFDEVAGINKYKHRKRAAMKKLAETERNLVRINDVIHELEHETESLQRQAEKAETYQQRLAELRKLEIEINARQYIRFRQELKEAHQKTADSRQVIHELSATIEKSETQIELTAQQRSELDAAISDAHLRVRKFESEIERTESSIAIYKERQLSLHQQRQRALDEIGSLETQIEELNKQRIKYEQEREGLENDIKLKENKLLARQRVLKQFGDRIKAAEQSIEEDKTKLIDVLSQSSRVQNQISSLDNKLEYTSLRLERLSKTSNQAQAELEQVQTRLEESQRHLNAIDADLMSMDAEQQELEQGIESRQRDLRKFEAELKGIQQSLGMNVSRLKSLRDLQESYEGYYTGVRAILKAREVEPETFAGVCGVVAELIRTEPEYETAVEVALGSGLQNVITETAEDAREGVAFLKRTRVGRVTFLPLDILRARHFRDHRVLDQPGVIGLASKLVDYDAKYQVAIDYLLGGTVVVEDLETAIEITRSLRPNVRFVSLDGELINASGAITGGSSKQASSGLLQRGREIEELQQKVQKLSEQLNQKERQRKETVQEIGELQPRRQQILAERQQKQIERAELAKDLQQHQQRHEHLERELSISATEEEQVKQETESIRIEREQIQEQHETLEKQQRVLERRIERLTEQTHTESARHEGIAKECTDMKIELAGCRERVQSLRLTLQNLADNQVQLERSIESQHETIASEEKTREELSVQIDEEQRKFLMLEQTKSEAAEAAASLEHEREELVQHVAALEKELRAQRRRLEREKQTKHEHDVNATQFQMQLNAISARVQEKYRVSIEDACPDPENTADETQLQLLIDELKVRIDGMGSVNLLAIEEYKQHQERHIFLTSQRDDLERSLQDTYRAIEKINQTSRERFMESFERIQKNFQEVFVQLFDGGETELLLTDPEDVLESGIEIIARPPGKRPQSITMLSGGERSLVAIALLFAVFKIKPSPFCVLDEVDAALDEANVMRFTRLIKEFAKDTQFIIITHNKRTMEIADVMYGVTMEQAGVSKLVSVKFAA